MAFHLASAPGDGFLRLVLTGTGNDAKVGRIVTAVADAVRAAAAPRVLIDVRGVRGRLGVTDTYFLVRSYPADLHAVRTAVVETEEYRKAGEFHETAAANTGRALRFFFDEPSAIAWLKSQA
jgi:hypothetical protein